MEIEEEGEMVRYVREGGRVKRERERMGDGRELGSKRGRERGWRERERAR